MKTSGFIPVDKRHNEIFVILNKNSLSNKLKIEELIKNKYTELTPKFIPVESSDFESLLMVVNEPIVSAETEVSVSSEEQKEPSAEEMLVTIGWLTQAQLDECVEEAKQSNEPLDKIFHRKEYLSYERIVSYLKKKYNCEVISKSNIEVDQSILKMLPDDFIEKKKTIILSMEGNKLAVAMVDPSDRYTIRSFIINRKSTQCILYMFF
jgi:hypothetical protein